jgi:hypothetical protein
MYEKKVIYSMTTEVNKTARPSSITLISVLAIIGALQIFWALLYPSISTTILRFGAWFALYLAFGAVVLLSCGVGLWLMKKWAVYTYTVFVFISQIALFAMGRWNIVSLLIPAVTLYVGYKHLSKMS